MEYRRPWLRGDLLGGLTMAAYVVPQMMAYSAIAGLPVVTGLWAVLLPLLLYALLGTSRLLAVGPESATAVMTATAVAPLAAGDPTRYATLAAALAVVTGLLAVLAPVARLGFLADLLSKPVLVGYLAGLAVTMVVGQLGKITKVSVEGMSLPAEVRSFVAGVPDVHGPTVALATAVLLGLFLVQWRLPRLPGPLLLVLGATVAVAAFDLQRYGIAVVGSVPSGLPLPALPDVSAYIDLVAPAFGVLLVAFADTILTARSFASRAGADAGSNRGTDIDANVELRALGACNIGAGLLRGFPVSSSASRTALNEAAGAHTQLSSLVTLICVVGVLLFAGPLLAQFPLAALGALIIYAAVRLVDLAELRRLAAFRRSELLLALATAIGVLLVGLLYGVVLAVGLSVVLLLVQVSRPHDAIQGIVPGLAGMHDIDDYPQAAIVPGLVVYRYDSPLFFANAEDFRRRALAAAEFQGSTVSWFVLNMEANVEVDITGLDAVEAVRTALAERGIVLALARVKRDLQDELDAYGLTERIGVERIFPTLPTAVAAYEATHPR
jgi:SulP family sulfate permease